MRELLAELAERHDTVIIDTPPVNLVSDAAILAEKITGYVFVVQSGKNHYYELSYALDTIQQMNGNVVGIILNDLMGKAASHYGNYRSASAYYSKGYYYRRGYGRSYYNSYYSTYESKPEPMQPKQPKQQETKQTDKTDHTDA